MTDYRLTRRNALGLALGVGVAAWRRVPLVAQESRREWISAPIGWQGTAPGDGFAIGHGFACENTWFSAGWWHTGEDWYAIDRDTAGANVYAVADGEVAYADFNYPGRVVIIEHAPDLYSMYGHLQFELNVQPGQRVAAGDTLGKILAQAGVKARGQAPSHLHFELRTFLTRDDVNGNAPQYGVNCGFQCPPGPGYWPMTATEHPAELGWRNPLLARFDRIDLDGLELTPQSAAIGESVRVLAGPGLGMPVRKELSLDETTRLPVLDLIAGDPASTGTSAETYEAWFKVTTPAGTEGWIQGAVPSDRETGSDGRPSSVDLPFLMSRSSDSRTG